MVRPQTNQKTGKRAIQKIPPGQGWGPWSGQGVSDRAAELSECAQG